MADRTTGVGVSGECMSMSMLLIIQLNTFVHCCVFLKPSYPNIIFVDIHRSRQRARTSSDRGRGSNKPPPPP